MKLPVFINPNTLLYASNSASVLCQQSWTWMVSFSIDFCLQEYKVTYLTRHCYRNLEHWSCKSFFSFSLEASLPDWRSRARCGVAGVLHGRPSWGDPAGSAIICCLQLQEVEYDQLHFWAKRFHRRGGGRAGARPQLWRWLGTISVIWKERVLGLKEEEVCLHSSTCVTW